jgi:hypothetical protein
MDIHTPTDVDKLPIIMTQQEVANLLRIDIRTLKKWKGTIRGFPSTISVNARTILFKRDDILAWIDKQQDLEG